MRLAIWDSPPAEFIVSGLTTGAVQLPFEIERTSARGCEELIRQGQVDMALLPTVRVLLDKERYDVLPAVALSTWRYPYARLVLRQALNKPIQTVSFDPRYVQEVLVARVVLKEHYGARPTFVPLENPTRQQLLDREEDATLLVGNDVPFVRSDHYVMDVGQEWFELSNYPMVWGLFVMRRDEGTPEQIEQLRRLARTSEQQRAVWIRAQETGEALHQFFSDDLRVRLDDLAIAGLTAFREYLFYYDVVDEVADVNFIHIPEEDDDEGRDGPPIRL